MRWAVYVANRGATEQDVSDVVAEQATVGREVAAAVPWGEREGILLIFRPIPRGGPAHVTATLVDRDGYAR